MLIKNSDMESLSIEELERKAVEKEKNYEVVNGDYICKICGTEILAIVVIFSIHDGPFPLSGSGKTIRQNFPYCPKCETRPEIHGMPVTTGR
jgi:hypothetical protein